MAKYSYVTSRRRVDYKRIGLVLLCVSCIAAGGMGTRTYFIKQNIKDAKMSIAEIEKEKIILQEQLETLEQKTTELEEEANRLEEILWRYEPVVIPDSMK